MSEASADGMAAGAAHIWTRTEVSVTAFPSSSRTEVSTGVRASGTSVSHGETALIRSRRAGGKVLK